MLYWLLLNIIVAILFKGIPHIAEGAARKIAITSLPVLLVFTIFSPLYYEFPSIKSEHKLYDREGGRFVERPHGFFSLAWVDDYWYIPTEGARMPVYSRVSVITESLKAETIRYEVYPKISDPERFYKNHLDAHESGVGDLEQPFCATYNTDFMRLDERYARNVVQKIVGRHLIDFNNHHSLEVAWFNNPADPYQYLRFKAFVEGWLNEHLEGEGLTASLGRVYVE